MANYTLHLQDSEYKELKRLARQYSYELGTDISVAELIRRAINTEYFQNQNENDNKE